MPARITRHEGMLPAMVEEGPEAFIKRWSEFAAPATLFARSEGSPLLEAAVGGVIVQLLERTNPYQAGPGAARLLLNPTADTVMLAPEGAGVLVVPRRGALHGSGEVVEVEGRVLVVDAGVPVLVVAPADADAEVRRTGVWIRFEASPPVHGFVLDTERRATPSDRADIDEAH